MGQSWLRVWMDTTGKGKVVGYDGEFVIVKTKENDCYYSAFNESRLTLSKSPLDKILHILYNDAGTIPEQADEILKLFNKGEDK
jgi:hypothetical protein